MKKLTLLGLILSFLLIGISLAEKIPENLEPFCMKITENLIKNDAKKIYEMGSPAFKALGKPERLQRLLSAIFENIGEPQKVDWTIEGYQIFQGGKVFLVKCILYYKRPVTVKMRIKETPTGFLLDALNVNVAPSQFLRKLIILAAQGKIEQIYEEDIPEDVKKNVSKKIITDILGELKNFIRAKWELQSYTIKDDGSEYLVYKITDERGKNYQIDFTVKERNGKYYLLDLNIKSL